LCTTYILVARPCAVQLAYEPARICTLAAKAFAASSAFALVRHVSVVTGVYDGFLFTCAFCTLPARRYNLALVPPAHVHVAWGWSGVSCLGSVRSSDQGADSCQACRRRRRLSLSDRGHPCSKGRLTADVRQSHAPSHALIPGDELQGCVQYRCMM
jgi:hypothetical protein